MTGAHSPTLLLEGSHPAGSGDTLSMTDGTQQRQATARIPAPQLVAAEFDRLRATFAVTLEDFLVV